MKLFLSIALTFLFSVNFAQDSLKNEAIKRFLKIQGTEERWSLSFEKMIATQKRGGDEEAQQFWEKFKEKIEENSYERLYEKVIPIYHEHFSIEEIEGLIAFYGTDLGQALLEKQPIVMEASYSMGEVVAAEIVEEINIEKEEDLVGKYNKRLLDCSDIKSGKFTSTVGDGQEIVVERKGKFQYEYFDGSITKYKVNWLDECTYSLKVLETDASFMKDMVGKTLITNIFEINDDHYKYICTMEETDVKMEGSLYFAE